MGPEDEDGEHKLNQPGGLFSTVAERKLPEFSNFRPKTCAEECSGEGKWGCTKWGARLRGRTATQRSKKGSEKVLGRVLRRGVSCGF